MNDLIPQPSSLLNFTFARLQPVIMAIILAATPAWAASLFWDGTDTTANADGGAGIWNTTNTNWDNAATGGVNTAWGTGANGHTANFGGVGGTVTLGSDMGTSGAYPNSINVTAGNYVLDLNSLGLAWRGSGLTISSGATLTIQNGTVTILNTGVSVTGTNALTISAKVTEASAGTSFSKFGAGDITLTNNANDFTGKLFGQNGGTVSFSSIANGGVASAAGAGSIVETGINNTMRYTGGAASTNRTLSLIGSGASTFKNDGTGALVWAGAFANTKTDANTLNLGGSNTGANDFQGAIINSTNAGQALSVNKQDAGTWILSGANTYSGGTTVSAGTLSFGSTTAIGTGAMTLSGGNLDSSVANLVNANNNAQNWNSNFSFVGTQSLNLGTGAVTLNATRQVTVTANTLTVGGAISGSGFGLTKAGAGVLSLSGANIYTGTTTLSAGTLRADAADVPATSGALGNGGTITFTGGTLQYTANSATTDYSTRITSSTAAAIKLDTNGQNVTFGTALSSSNTGGLTKEGAGQLELKMSAAAQYTGTTTINGGTLKFVGTADLNFINSSSININNGASLVIYTDFNRTTLSNGKTFTFGSTGGGSIIYDKGNHLWQSSVGKFVTTGGTQNTISSANGGFINPQNSNTVNFDIADGSDAVDLLVSVTITSGNYTKSGAGTLSITSSSTLGGGAPQPNLTINAGTFDVGGTARLTTSGQAFGVVTSDILNNGVYRHSSSGAQTLSGVISGSGSLIKSNSASTVTLSGTTTNTFSGLTTVNGGTLLLNKTAGVNAISGNVTIGDASGVDILQLSASDQIANTSILTFNGASANAGTFRMNAQNETVGGIASTSGAGIIENGTSGTSTLTLDVNTTDRVFSGIIQNGAAGTLALTKIGTGAQTITGANTYSGVTTVSAGSLQVGSSGTGTTGTGAVTVQTGGVILGTGVVQGSSFTAESGSTIRPGDTVANSSHGTLTFSPVTTGTHDVQSGSSVILGISTATTTNASFGGNTVGSAGYDAWLDGISGVGGHDRLVFNGTSGSTLAFSGNLSVIGNSYSAQLGDVFNLLDWASLVSSNFSGFATGTNYRDGTGDNGSQFDLPDISSSGYFWDISRFASSGNIAVVPEPSRALLMMLGLAGLVSRRRRP